MKQTIDCSIYPGVVPPVAHYSQFDVIEGGLDIRLLYDGQPYTDAGIAVINGVKPDGKVFQYFAKINPENPSIVTVDITEQMTSVGTPDSEKVTCELRLRNVNGTQDIGTVNFILDIEQSPLTKVILSESDFSTLQSVVDSTNAIDSKIRGLSQSLEDTIDEAKTDLNRLKDELMNQIQQYSGDSGATVEPLIYVNKSNVATNEKAANEYARITIANGSAYKKHITVKGDATGNGTSANPYKNGNIAVTSTVDGNGIGNLQISFVGTIATKAQVEAIVT